MKEQFSPVVAELPPSPDKFGGAVRKNLLTIMAGAVAVTSALVILGGTYLGYSAVANSTVRSVPTVEVGQGAASNVSRYTWPYESQGVAESMEVLHIEPESGNSNTRAIFLPGNRMPANYQGNIEVAQLFAANGVPVDILAYPDNALQPGAEADDPGFADGVNDWGDSDQSTAVASYLVEVINSFGAEEDDDWTLILMAESQGAHLALNAITDQFVIDSALAAGVNVRLVLSSPLTDFGATVTATNGKYPLNLLFGNLGAAVYGWVHGHSLSDINNQASAALINNAAAALGERFAVYTVACEDDPTNPEAETAETVGMLGSGVNQLYVVAEDVNTHVCTLPDQSYVVRANTTGSAEQVGESIDLAAFLAAPMASN